MGQHDMVGGDSLETLEKVCFPFFRELTKKKEVGVYLACFSFFTMSSKPDTILVLVVVQELHARNSGSILSFWKASRLGAS